MTDEPAERPKESLNALKFLVFSMGMLMIGGTVLLGAIVWKKVTQENSERLPPICLGGEIDLSGHGNVISVERDGRLLFLTTQKNSQTLEVTSIHLCSGLSSTITVAIDGMKEGMKK